MKHVAPLRQYHAAYAGGHAYVWNVMLGRMALWLGGRGFGVDLDEHAAKEEKKTQRYYLMRKGVASLNIPLFIPIIIIAH